jgi:hypothetical protein
MIEYIWKIEKIETLVLKEYKDFISYVQWSVSAKENDKIITEIVSFGYKYEDAINYISFNELTEEIVMGWVKDRLGENGIEHFENLVLNKLNSLELLITEEKPLPWVK